MMMNRVDKMEISIFSKFFTVTEECCIDLTMNLRLPLFHFYHQNNEGQ